MLEGEHRTVARGMLGIPFKDYIVMHHGINCRVAFAVGRTHANHIRFALQTLSDLALPITVALLIHFVIRDKNRRRTIDAMPHSTHFWWTIFENMTQVRIRVPAAHLHTFHPMARICLSGESIFGNRFRKRRPSTMSRKFIVRRVQGLTTDWIHIDTGIEIRIILSCAWPFRRICLCNIHDHVGVVHVIFFGHFLKMPFNIAVRWLFEFVAGRPPLGIRSPMARHGTAVGFVKSPKRGGYRGPPSKGPPAQ
mmetsp:Transcript_13972/g.23149  ORF Transcript_13972/g.23149 Transcript_13972/m.23149 type:complete len:251 (-) Transcript_13972:33-785(-)